MDNVELSHTNTINNNDKNNNNNDNDNIDHIKGIEQKLRENDEYKVLTNTSHYLKESIEVPISLKVVDKFLSFPCIESQLKFIIDKYATKDQKKIVDLTTAKTNIWQINLNKIQVGGKTWPNTIDSILNRVKEVLGIACDEKIEVELQKFLILGQGSFIDNNNNSSSSSSSKNNDKVIANLFLILPSEHTGGEVSIEYSNSHYTTLNLENNTSSEIVYLGFYSDCKYQISPINSGYRVCLLYNLKKTGKRTLNSNDLTSMNQSSVAHLKYLNSLANQLLLQLSKKDNSKLIYILNSNNSRSDKDNSHFSSYRNRNLPKLIQSMNLSEPDLKISQILFDLNRNRDYNLSVFLTNIEISEYDSDGDDDDDDDDDGNDNDNNSNSSNDSNNNSINNNNNSKHFSAKLISFIDLDDLEFDIEFDNINDFQEISISQSYLLNSIQLDSSNNKTKSKEIESTLNSNPTTTTTSTQATPLSKSSTTILSTKKIYGIVLFKRSEYENIIGKESTSSSIGVLALLLKNQIQNISVRSNTTDIIDVADLILDSMGSKCNPFDPLNKNIEAIINYFCPTQKDYIEKENKRRLLKYPKDFIYHLSKYLDLFTSSEINETILSYNKDQNNINIKESIEILENILIPFYKKHKIITKSTITTFICQFQDLILPLYKLNNNNVIQPVDQANDFSSKWKLLDEYNSTFESYIKKQMKSNSELLISPNIIIYNQMLKFFDCLPEKLLNEKKEFVENYLQKSVIKYYQDSTLSSKQLYECWISLIEFGKEEQMNLAKFITDHYKYNIIWPLILLFRKDVCSKSTFNTLAYSFLLKSLLAILIDSKENSIPPVQLHAIWIYLFNLGGSEKQRQMDFSQYIVNNYQFDKIWELLLCFKNEMLVKASFNYDAYLFLWKSLATLAINSLSALFTSQQLYYIWINQKDSDFQKEFSLSILKKYSQDVVLEFLGNFKLSTKSSKFFNLLNFISIWKDFIQMVYLDFQTSSCQPIQVKNYWKKLLIGDDWSNVEELSSLSIELQSKLVSSSLGLYKDKPLELSNLFIEIDKTMIGNESFDYKLFLNIWQQYIDTLVKEKYSALSTSNIYKTWAQLLFLKNSLEQQGVFINFIINGYSFPQIKDLIKKIKKDITDSDQFSQKSFIALWTKAIGFMESSISTLLPQDYYDVWISLLDNLEQLQRPCQQRLIQIILDSPKVQDILILFKNEISANQLFNPRVWKSFLSLLLLMKKQTFSPQQIYQIWINLFAIEPISTTLQLQMDLVVDHITKLYSKESVFSLLLMFDKTILANPVFNQEAFVSLWKFYIKNVSATDVCLTPTQIYDSWSILLNLDKERDEIQMTFAKFIATTYSLEKIREIIVKFRVALKSSTLFHQNSLNYLLKFYLDCIVKSKSCLENQQILDLWTTMLDVKDDSKDYQAKLISLISIYSIEKRKDILSLNFEAIRNHLSFNLNVFYTFFKSFIEDLKNVKPSIVLTVQQIYSFYFKMVELKFDLPDSNEIQLLFANYIISSYGRSVVYQLSQTFKFDIFSHSHFSMNAFITLWKSLVTFEFLSFSESPTLLSNSIKKKVNPCNRQNCHCMVFNQFLASENSYINLRASSEEKQYLLAQLPNLGCTSIEVVKSSPESLEIVKTPLYQYKIWLKTIEVLCSQYNTIASISPLFKSQCKVSYDLLVTKKGQPAPKLPPPQPPQYQQASPPPFYSAVHPIPHLIYNQYPHGQNHLPYPPSVQPPPTPPQRVSKLSPPINNHETNNNSHHPAPPTPPLLNISHNIPQPPASMGPFGQQPPPPPTIPSKRISKSSPPTTPSKHASKLPLIINYGSLNNHSQPPPPPETRPISPPIPQSNILFGKQPPPPPPPPPSSEPTPTLLYSPPKPSNPNLKVITVPPKFKEYK
ncbi:hypothetical protein CYY_001587 [Polysphondylium violaceum]|uniref:Uncharacterized protein n=1 Tax=Polysphondylium violaceum TaxID=133409 RepID=A0A8J4PZJ1_9MYCE|nr:hypothetical protein CYY_001587 [Polysphondylium violaceum]